MPPWGAVNGFGDFSGDQALTQEQIGMIAEWVEGGAPEGDPALLPKPSGILGDSHGKGAGLENSGPAPPTTEILVNDVLALKAPLTLAGIRPKRIPGGASVMVVAERPDGSIEPLLWLYNFQARFARAYFYRAALRFVPGTRIKVSPPGAGTVALLAAQRKSIAQRVSLWFVGVA